MKTTAEIRRGYLHYFQSKGHQIVDSSPLVPEDDPTLLFINAGMNQFKNVFLGLEKRPYTRATTAQRCVRAGGKHNDLENVGFTARHHTFFEMMGNFSFGDYFKRDAIHFAWGFLTGKDQLALDPNRLTVTVYETDDEAYNIWADEIGVPKERIIRIGDNKGAPYASDNFWQMADTGPCGPCTEIFYDHGEHIWGGPPGSPEEDGDRFIEIWNIVFMQFNRKEDGTMEKLPRPSVDTGMGIERVAAIKQHVTSNYDIDVFKRLVARAAEVTDTADYTALKTRQSLNVIADHARSSTFLVADGVLPSNEGRGYVLRRIIRRAIRHGYLLGCKHSFFHKLVKDVVEVMEDAAEYISAEKVAFIEKILRLEEEQFQRTLERGLQLLQAEIAKLDQEKVLPGKVAFTLLDTYGFPLDLTVDWAGELGVQVDVDGFNTYMEEQRALAKAASKFTADYANVIKTDLVTEKLFYVNKATTGKGVVTALYKEGQQVDAVAAGEEVVVITSASPFYGESGGQVGDTGVITSTNAELKVTDTQKYALALGHHATVQAGELKVGDQVELVVDAKRRKAIELNHSVTHLLHAALRDVCGEHVAQKGSYTGAEVARFDVSSPEPITAEQLVKVEQLVNFHIRANHKVETVEMPIEEAKKTGARMLFTEKYGDTVRVVSMSPFSVELCGGTHVDYTGEIGLFKILSESGLAAGVRRLEFVSGAHALAQVQQESALLAQVAELTKASKADSPALVEQTYAKVRQLEKDLQKAKEELALAKSAALLSQVELINGVETLVAQTADFEANTLKAVAADLVNRAAGDFVLVLFNRNGGAANLLVAQKGNKVKAGDLVKKFTALFGGKGGGRPDLAMGSVAPETDFSAAIAQVKAELAA